MLICTCIPIWSRYLLLFVSSAKLYRHIQLSCKVYKCCYGGHIDITSTVTSSSIITSAASKNFYNNSRMISRSNDVRDSSSPENISPHLPSSSNLALHDKPGTNRIMNYVQNNKNFAHANGLHSR